MEAVREWELSLREAIFESMFCSFEMNSDVFATTVSGTSSSLK